MLLKTKKMPEYITDDIEISCDSDRGDSVKKFPMKKILIKKIIMKKIKHRIRLFLYLKYFE